ncbi:restriction endonuclease [Streptomyces sp. NPDC096193]|uniref:restriction endonuclease n=1 Tax=Streptomyces sp. NPDC096193 TaxID=3155821 RepID=UPI00332ED5FC
MLADLRITLAEIDALDDQEFEIALRDLLIRDGWAARRVGREGDQAADVIGQNAQLGRIVVQAKHTKVGGKVGSQKPSAFRTWSFGSAWVGMNSGLRRERWGGWSARVAGGGGSCRRFSVCWRPGRRRSGKR